MKEKIKTYLQTLTEPQLLDIATTAIFYLFSVSGTRNSFHPDFLSKLNYNAISIKRTEEVEFIHRTGAQFVQSIEKQLYKSE